MAVQAKPEDKPARYEVLRAICMQGERIEVGSVLTIDHKPLAAELIAASKVAPTDKPAKLVKPKPAKPAEAAAPAPQAPAADLLAGSEPAAE